MRGIPGRASGMGGSACSEYICLGDILAAAVAASVSRIIGLDIIRWSGIRSIPKLLENYFQYSKMISKTANTRKNIVELKIIIGASDLN